MSSGHIILYINSENKCNNTCSVGQLNITLRDEVHIVVANFSPGCRTRVFLRVGRRRRRGAAYTPVVTTTPLTRSGIECPNWLRRQSGGCWDGRDVSIRIISWCKSTNTIAQTSRGDCFLSSRCRIRSGIIWISIGVIVATIRIRWRVRSRWVMVRRSAVFTRRIRGALQTVRLRWRLTVANRLWRVSKRLDMVRIQSKIIEVW